VLTAAIVQENPDRMVSLEDLAILANTNMITDDAAVERMRNHQKVQWDPSTDLYSYKVRGSHKCPRFKPAVSPSTDMASSLDRRRC
jgi:hypothetical protein